MYGEKLFRLSILLLGKGEVAAQPYGGNYQDKEGYVSSQRRGAPRGMKDSDWSNPVTAESPEAMLATLINSGYPWNLLGRRLAVIDQQFKTVTEEYGVILDSVKRFETEIKSIKETLAKNPEDIKQIIDATLREKALKAILGVATFFGAGLGILTNESLVSFLYKHGGVLGLLIVLVSSVWLITIFYLERKK